jgi:hypothetical protein
MSGTKKGEQPNFLSGWKEIANYLCKGVRTVQRYECELRLPIRRPAGKPRASVVATKAEIDAWIAASPFCEVFQLPQVRSNPQASTTKITTGVAEMRRLRGQMAELRVELEAAVVLLKESVESVQSGLSSSARNGQWFPTRDKAVANLLDIRVAGKAV